MAQACQGCMVTTPTVDPFPAIHQGPQEQGSSASFSGAPGEGRSPRLTLTAPLPCRGV